MQIQEPWDESPEFLILKSTGAPQLSYRMVYSRKLGFGCLVDNYFQEQEYQYTGVFLQEKTWHQVGIIWTGRNYRLFLDGVLAREADLAEAKESGAQPGWELILGKSDLSVGTVFPDLRLDDLRLYDRDIKNDTMASFYRENPLPPPPATDHQWEEKISRFVLTKGKYADVADWLAGAQKEFGPGAQIADWQEIRQLFFTEPKVLTQFLGLQVGENCFVHNEGTKTFLRNRVYILGHYQGAIPKNSLVHDVLAEESMALCSWFGNSYSVLVRLPEQYRSGAYFQDFPCLPGRASPRAPWRTTDEDLWKNHARRVPGGWRFDGSDGQFALSRPLLEYRPVEWVNYQWDGNLEPSVWGCSQGVEVLFQEGSRLACSMEIDPRFPQQMRLHLTLDDRVLETRLFSIVYGFHAWHLSLRQGEGRFSWQPQDQPTRWQEVSFASEKLQPTAIRQMRSLVTKKGEQPLYLLNVRLEGR